MGNRLQIHRRGIEFRFPFSPFLPELRVAHSPLFKSKNPNANHEERSSMMTSTPTHNSVLSAASRALWKASATAALLLFTRTNSYAAIQEQSEGNTLGSLFVNYYGFTVLFVLLLIGVLVYRKKSSPRKSDIFTSKSPARTATLPAESVAQAARKTAASAPVETERQTRPNAAPNWDGVTPDYEHSAFGAYRIDQEVGKLVLGKSHRMDVMASRIPDDRRAIEASLIKALSAPDTDTHGRVRARQALEEYGFVARQCALVLQGRDAWERSSAARVLGQIASPASLPSLIEALHDSDSVVRNQAVTSLGQLKQPAAIGALLDIARRHSDIPPSILSDSLSACSVDSLGYLDSSTFDFGTPENGAHGELQDLQQGPSFEKLPMGDEDDALLGLLSKLESTDSKDRTMVARDLSSHRSERSVAALCATALHDPDASVRSAAVTSLGSIDHESVFSTVLLALADETREVCAAAARTLSSLHFDRADAYARVTETTDTKMLVEVAQACIKTGIAGQAIDRLASEDRRQAFEAFSLCSLLAKAGEIQPLIEVIQTHPNERVRLAAVRVLNVAGRPDAAPSLRDLVAAEGMSEELRTSLLEVLYKLDREPAAVGALPSDNG